MGNSLNYSTGRLAKHLGITSQGLHWYESTGLVDPVRVNTYRQFNVQDLFILSRARFYHQLGLGQNEIDDLINGSLDSIAETMEELIQDKKKAMQKEQAILSVLQKRTSLINEMQGRLDKLECIEKEACYFLPSVLYDDQIDSSQSNRFKKWVDEIPLTQYAMVLDTDGSYDVGVMLPERFLPVVDPEIKQDALSGDIRYFATSKVVFGMYATVGETGHEIPQIVLNEYGNKPLPGPLVKRPITCHRVDDEIHAYWEVWIYS